MDLRLQLELDRLVDEVAARVVALLGDAVGARPRSPWMTTGEAIAYTRLPPGTFRKWAASGLIPSHGGRRRLYHEVELDAALGYDPRATRHRYAA